MRVGAVLLLALAVSAAGRGNCDGAQNGPLPAWRIERDIRRFQAVGNDRVMELLALRPGMTILDIGAGTGQFAFEFARRLDGTGAVYATDIQPSCIDSMKREAAGRNLRNLHPVLVEKDGVDPFYGSHRYDRITVFHVAMAFEDRVDYFRRMGMFLAKDGRLAIVLYRNPKPFSPEDFGEDFRGLLAALAGEPLESPYRRILAEPVRTAIRERPGAIPEETLKADVAAGFNRLLHDARFTVESVAGSYPGKEPDFRPEERRFADWALASIPGGIVRNREDGDGGAKGDTKYAAINKLLLVQRYRRFLKPEGGFVSGFTPAVRAAFESAGYRVEGEYSDAIPFEDLVVLSRESSAP